MVQKPDSIPPAIPSGLIANIDSLGVVQISWDPNKDVDILGYRLFKGNAKGEELVPINDIPISQTFYVDSVDMVAMNTHAYYAITAVDKRYNQSELSAVIEAKKPEVIPPSQPVIKNIEPLEGRNVIMWESGHESTLSGFLLMRYESGSSLPILIKIDDPQKRTIQSIHKYQSEMNIPMHAKSPPDNIRLPKPFYTKKVLCPQTVFPQKVILLILLYRPVLLPEQTPRTKRKTTIHLSYKV